MNIIRNFCPFLIWLALLMSIIFLGTLRSWWQEYLCLLRVPITAGILILSLPIIANNLAPSLLCNLFVMRDSSQLAFTLFGAAIAGLMISLVFSMIVINAPTRYKENLDSKPEWTSSIINSLKSIKVRYLLGLALPLLIQFYVAFHSGEELTIKEQLGGSFGGLLLILLLYLFVYCLRRWIRDKKVNTRLRCGIRYLKKCAHTFPFPVTTIINFLRFINTYLKDINDTSGYILTFSLGIIGLFVYIIVFIFNHPWWNFLPEFAWMKEPSALFYLLLIIWVATFLLGNLTFYVDYFRMPVLLSLIIFSGLSYFLFHVDYFFKLTPSSTQYAQYNFSQLSDLRIPIQHRLQNQGEQKGKTLVVVAASGGGIQAAGWTLEVLKGLNEELGLHLSMQQEL